MRCINKLFDLICCCRDRDEDGLDNLSEDEEEDDMGDVTSEDGETLLLKYLFFSHNNLCPPTIPFVVPQ